ncbi:hypothetical protein UG55_105748 [Frankia sp. EI5c]|nr:hypothetical protein UG55_105748 [Frankia sp. EI5c]
MPGRTRLAAATSIRHEEPFVLSGSTKPCQYGLPLLPGSTLFG